MSSLEMLDWDKGEIVPENEYESVVPLFILCFITLCIINTFITCRVWEWYNDMH